MKQKSKKKPIPFIRKLCSHLSEKEIERAEERFREYIRLAIRIHSRNGWKTRKINKADEKRQRDALKRAKNRPKIVFTRAKDD